MVNGSLSELLADSIILGFSRTSIQTPTHNRAIRISSQRWARVVGTAPGRQKRKDLINDRSRATLEADQSGSGSMQRVRESDGITTRFQNRLKRCYMVGGLLSGGEAAYLQSGSW